MIEGADGDPDRRLGSFGSIDCFNYITQLLTYPCGGFL